METGLDPYETLGVARDATADQVRAAHRRAAKLHHPDRGGDAEVFNRIQRAFDILRDPDKRRIFDETGAYDEQAIITFETRVRTAARSALMTVVLGTQDLERIDVISAALQHIQTQIDGLEIQRQQCDRHQTRLTIARARFRNLSEEHDVVSDIFEFQQADVRNTLPRIEEELKVQHAAADLLKRYAYSFELDGQPVSISRDGKTLNVVLG